MGDFEDIMNSMKNNNDVPHIKIPYNQTRSHRPTYNDLEKAGIIKIDPPNPSWWSGEYVKKRLRRFTEDP